MARQKYKVIMNAYWIFRAKSLILELRNSIMGIMKGSIRMLIGLIGKKVRVTPPMYWS